MRALYLWQLSSSPFWDTLIGDPARYDAWAREIAAGDWRGEGVFYQAPLYPYFLAVVYRLFGAAPLAARVVQCFVGAASCVLLALATRSFFGRRAAARAGALLALYPPALFFDALLQKSVLDMFFLALTLALAGRAWGRGARGWLATGVAAGCLALTRENALGLVAVLALWLLCDRARGDRRARLRASALFLAGVALVLAPVAVRNWRVGGELVLTSSQAGRNLYYGNRPGADGTYQPLRPGRGAIRWEEADARELAEAALGRRLSAAEISDYWSGRALAFVRERPGEWLRLMARKAFLALNALEIMDTEDQYSHRDHAPLAKALGWVLHFGVVLPLAALGAAVTRRDPGGRGRALLALLLAAYTASILVFFVLDRYRYPMVAILIPFAAAGLAGAAPGLRAMCGAGRAATFAGVGLLALVSNWPVMEVSRFEAETYNNLGATLAVEGERLELAARHLERSLRYRPEAAAPHHNLGIVHEKLGRPANAADEFARALELGPASANTLRHLAHNLAVLGRLEEAASAYERALALEPRDAAAWNRLGIARAELGRFAGAVAAFERALAVDAELSGAAANLERARARLAADAVAP